MSPLSQERHVVDIGSWPFCEVAADTECVDYWVTPEVDGRLSNGAFDPEPTSPNSR
jgi:hypothetical protein